MADNTYRYYAKTNRNPHWIKLEAPDLNTAKTLAQEFFKPAGKIWLSHFPDDLITDLEPGFNVVAEYQNGTWTATA